MKNKRNIPEKYHELGKKTSLWSGEVKEGPLAGHEACVGLSKISDIEGYRNGFNGSILIYLV